MHDHICSVTITTQSDQGEIVSLHTKLRVSLVRMSSKTSLMFDYLCLVATLLSDCLSANSGILMEVIELYEA